MERVLRELGPPLKVAQAYSLEMTVDEAVATGRVIPMARAFLHVATTTVGGFLAAVIVLWGYAASVILFSAAVLEFFRPRNVVLTFHYLVPVIRFSYPEIPAAVDQGGVLGDSVRAGLRPRHPRRDTPRLPKLADVVD